MIQNLPDDINIEDVLIYLPKDLYQVTIDGSHKRNSYRDIISCEELSDGKIRFHIGRNGLYNSLPEYMFHPINRYDNIPECERKERFSEEYAQQEFEKESAHKFFEPIDILLLDLKTMVKNRVNHLASRNIIMERIIGDTLTDKEKNNRYIKHVIPYLPNCKYIRGNKTLITLLLRKVLSEEGVKLVEENLTYDIVDVNPKYSSVINGSQLSAQYLGNVFDENITTYTLNYWSNEECNEQFGAFLEQIEEFRLFIKDYFLSVEEELCFNISTDCQTLRLSDDFIYNYLNYNANI